VGPSRIPQGPLTAASLQLFRLEGFRLGLSSGRVERGVTSDNVSPLHLMDIKRVAFETRPIEGVTPVPIDAVWEFEMAA
jgi:hypothetical protein